MPYSGAYFASISTNGPTLHRLLPAETRPDAQTATSMPLVNYNNSNRGYPARVIRYTKDGYLELRAPWHPLAMRNGYVSVARARLYAKIGPGVPASTRARTAEPASSGDQRWRLIT